MLPEKMIILLICIVVYFMGYYLGSNDSYAEGYMNAKTNIHQEEPSYFRYENLLNEFKFCLEHLAEFFDYEYFFLEDTPEINVNYINKDDLVSDRTVKTVAVALAELPSELLAQFNEDGYHLVLQKDPITLSYANNSTYRAVGLYAPYNDEIVVYAGLGGVKETVVHEFGHYFAEIYNNIDQSREWKSIYQQEWEGFYYEDRNFHHIGSNEEYFAAAFNWYINKPDKLKEICPESYAFINRAIKDFSNG